MYDDGFVAWGSRLFKSAKKWRDIADGIGCGVNRTEHDYKATAMRNHTSRLNVVQDDLDIPDVDDQSSHSADDLTTDDVLSEVISSHQHQRQWQHNFSSTLQRTQEI